MGRSPLDTAFAGGKSRKQGRRGFASIAILGIAGIASASSVFAASVGINGGNTISYSQGTQLIAACDNNIPVALGAFFNGSVFVMDTIVLTDIDSDCNGKDLTLNLYDGTTLMLTVVGEIGTAGSATIGQANQAIANVSSTTSADASFTGFEDTSAKAITLENSKTAANIASDADRIVVEIN